MSEIPEPLRAIKLQVDAGKTPVETVRTLLSWFGHARRRTGVVERIREALEALELVTLPDFEGEYIDSPVGFHRKATPAVEPSEATTTTTGDPAQVTVQVTGPGVSQSYASGAMTVQSIVEPAYRISRLAAANTPPVWVNPEATVRHAVTLMLIHDFTQLPVMRTDREVKGIVSWKSLGSRLALGQGGSVVRECMDSVREISADSSIFDAIPIIAEHDCVLVRSKDQKISGIITAADISEQFRQLAEPFLLLGHIETQVRALISASLSPDDVRSVGTTHRENRPVNSATDMSYGDYVSLLGRDEIWKKLATPLDKKTFVSALDEIRKIRNDVMHFDPDGVEDATVCQLRRFASFLDRHRQLTANEPKKDPS